MPAARSILLINHTFPPYKGIGGRRWVKFAKALTRRGWTVHVIHSAGPEALKGSLWTDDLHTPGIVPHPLPQRYPTVLFKRPLNGLWERLGYHAWSRVLPLLVRGNWLDKTVFWRGPLLRKAGDLIQAHGIRQVIVTGAPFRLCAFAVELKKRHSVKLICDLRDPWTWQDTYGGDRLSSVRKAYERTLEAKMMAGADHITTPHPSAIEHLAQQYPEQRHKLYLLPHAIDPDELGHAVPHDGHAGFRMIYAGSMKGGAEVDQYFTTLIAAFTDLRTTRPDLFHRTTLDLHITGHDTTHYQDAVARASLTERIRFLPPLVPKELARRISASDAVLIFLPTSTKELLGTKFNEIFHLQRPVIHVGVACLIGEHIQRHSLGISIRTEQLVAELPGWAAGTRALPTAPQHDLGAHLLDPITERFEEEVLNK